MCARFGLPQLGPAAGAELRIVPHPPVLKWQSDRAGLVASSPSVNAPCCLRAADGTPTSPCCCPQPRAH
jgi:hypothetical protein